MTGGTIAGIIISQQILGNKHPWSDVRSLRFMHICAEKIDLLRDSDAVQEYVLSCNVWT